MTGLLVTLLLFPALVFSQPSLARFQSVPASAEKSLESLAI
jgi:hypothetical protein